MSTLRKLLPWNWGVDWRSLLPWNWGRGAPVSHAGEYTFDVAVPGLGPEDVEVVLEGRDLVIRGAHDEVEDRTEGGYRWHRVRRDVVVRRVHLPLDIDAEQVDATVQDGMLTVRLPRLANAAGGPRRIEVQHLAIPAS